MFGAIENAPHIAHDTHIYLWKHFTNTHKTLAILKSLTYTTLFGGKR